MPWLSARDVRSLLIPVLADRPDRVFGAAELAALLEESAGPLHRRADRMVFDAMRKAVHCGWVVRVGRGRYRFGAMAPTTLRRVRRWNEGMSLGLDGWQRSAYSNWRPIPPGP